jgi:acetyltransferase-like isoleucine patch superfamily enzyme
VNDYIRARSTSVPRYLLEQTIYFVLQTMPSVVGVILRGVCYRLIIKSDGLFGIEENVQISHARNLRLGKGVFIGRNCSIGASDGGIELRDAVTILDNCYLNVFNYDGVSRKSIVVGKNAVLSHGCVIHGHSGVEIGENTIVGPNTVFVSGNHGVPSKEANYRLVKGGVDTPIRVGKNVWLGTNVTVLPGVTIGDNAVVGAGSVVTKDIPDFSVYAGNPAVKVREID